MNSHWTELLGQLRGFAQQHLPTESTPSVGWIAVVLLASGITLSVLGARMARRALTLACLLAGGGMGLRFAEQVDWSRGAEIGLVAGLAVGTAVIGYFVYRLWVGVAVAALLAIGGTLAFNHARVLPALAQFDHAAYVAGASDSASFALIDPATQAGLAQASPRRWLTDFYADLTANDPGLRRSLLISGAAWGAAGLALGLLLTRAVVVLFSSALGTAAFAGGAALLASSFRPEAYARATANPLPVAAAIGCCFLTSLVLQSLLTRRPPPKPAPAA